MFGPFPAGQWMASVAPRDFGPLQVGARYEVVEPFVDHDRVTHEAGESWRFLGHNFLPYDDGLSLFVSLDDAQEWHIRMQWRPEEQGPVIDDLASHVRMIEAPRAAPWIAQAQGPTRRGFWDWLRAR
jgi:hypothetical protein